MCTAVLIFGCGTAAAQDVPSSAKKQLATFAGGCFWCMMMPFKQLPGVVSVVAGYTGGHVADPTYEQVSSGRTGHAESVQVMFHPEQVSYEKLLEVYWHNIDPTTPNRQFCDNGDQYRTAIFYSGEEQKRLAEASRNALAASGVLKGPIVTEIIAASRFYPAEDFHQDYFRKHELAYQIYRHRCGRDQRLAELYGQSAGH